MVIVTSLQDYRQKKQAAAPSGKAAPNMMLVVLENFDFRNFLSTLPNQEREGALKSQFRVIDAAYGAVIARRVKLDTESADVLTQFFKDNLHRHEAGITELPDFARGYVYDVSSRLMAYARAAINTVKKD